MRLTEKLDENKSVFLLKHWKEEEKNFSLCKEINLILAS